MKLSLPKRNINHFLKSNFNEIFSQFINNKKQFLLILVLFILTTGYANSKNMTCALPAHNLVEKSPQQPQSYIELLEPKTTLQLGILRKIQKFNSPGCHKMEAVTFWTNSLEIECKSNDGTEVALQINFLTSKFGKTYTQKNQKIRSLTGFCSKLKDEVN